ncbi:hypothetical protein NDU88_002301 [Pleurodeles waltl]|uniref:Uncharacterized protein n=1 Tax=Pleurodeles waltl TaxID=8319 RepID=A0AAV7VDA1_PLEWA|nr:hypothetical protein NDU88_002301 [Pleurodeles waltl]
MATAQPKPHGYRRVVRQPLAKTVIRDGEADLGRESADDPSPTASKRGSEPRHTGHTKAPGQDMSRSSRHLQTERDQVDKEIQATPELSSPYAYFAMAPNPV